MIIAAQNSAFQGSSLSVFIGCDLITADHIEHGIDQQ